VERKTNQPQEQYKLHLSDVQEQLVAEQQKAMDAMEHLQTQLEKERKKQ
jgi:hypothetical protein